MLQDTARICRPVRCCNCPFTGLNPHARASGSAGQEMEELVTAKLLVFRIGGIHRA